MVRKCPFGSVVLGVATGRLVTQCDPVHENANSMLLSCVRNNRIYREKGNGMGQRKRHRKKRVKGFLEKVNLYAAGIDIGSKNLFVAVPEELDEQPVREFLCFTGDLHRLADWLVKIGIQTVAMESTGVYWIPVYEILEERGLEVLLVNARHVKNVPGRKSDVQDCQWLQQLHTYGLLEGAFRPPEETVALRNYMRQRETLIQGASDQLRRMQKALRQMNLLLDNVISDISGTTGMAIIRAILAGERDARRLAKFRDGRCANDEETIAASLEGHYKEEQLFALKQSMELYDFYQQQIQACDERIEKQLQKIDTKGDGGAPPSKGKRKNKSSFSFDLRSKLYRMTGVDLTQIEGFNETTALKILSETGTDMTAWPTEKHFCSWLGLSPGNKVSGGKILKSKTKPTASRAAGAFRIAAYTLFNSKSALGAYYRRQRSRLGAPKAITATAHKLARIFYSMIKNGAEYVKRSLDEYERQYRNRITRNLKRRAAEMGYELVNKTEYLDKSKHLLSTT